MHFSKFSLVASLLCALSAQASPIAQIQTLASDVEDALSKRNVLSRRQDGCTTENPITGVDDGSILARPSIYDMEGDGDLWNIYILGLLRMQDKDQRDPLSYYRIASIHARPFGRSYDGQDPINDGTGWASHTSTIFFTWHRVYTALFEQILHTNMQEVVETFEGEDRERYEAALGRFRVPWWDPTMEPSADRPVYPESMSTERMLVQTPDGEDEVRNPLFSYVFRPASAELGREPFSTYQSSLRFPSSAEPDAQSRNDLVRRSFENNQPSFKQRMYNLFTNYRDFNQFSNAAWIQDNLPDADSAESVHNVIHGIVGSGGHMSFLDVGSFDPAFFLVHTNADRWVAIWQSLWPESWVEPGPHERDTSSISAGDTTDVDTPLAPFSATSQCQNWTSRWARYTQVFGYTYDDAQGDVRATVNSLYGPVEAISRKVKRSDEDNKKGSEEDSEEDSEAYSKENSEEDDDDESNEPDDGEGNEVTAYSAAGGKIRDYFVTIKSTKFDLNGSYFVYIFLGPPSEDAEEWPLDENLVGTHCVLAPSDASDEVQNKDLIVAGSVPLSKALNDVVKAGELDSLEEADVAPYLHENLHWRLAKSGPHDEEVDPQTVRDLKVTVGSIEIRNAESASDLPEREGQVHKLSEATSGKPAGSTEEDHDD